jgi:hypothetical protein
MQTHGSKDMYFEGFACFFNKDSVSSFSSFRKTLENGIPSILKRSG